jgi:hypothetical protein
VFPPNHGWSMTTPLMLRLPLSNTLGPRQHMVHNVSARVVLASRAIVLDYPLVSC